MTTPIATLGAWMHDLSPIAFRVTEGFSIRWYGLSYLAGFAAAYLLLRILAKRGATLIPADRALDVILTLVVGVVVGGRLGYVLLYEPRLLGLIDGFPFWGVLAVNRGGMASHGGILGVAIAAWKVSRGFKDEHGNRVGVCPPLHAMDVCTLIAPAGLFFGRIANFINGELLGKIIAAPGQAAPSWAVRYPQEILRYLQELQTNPDLSPPQTPEQMQAIARLVDQYALPEEGFYAGYERLMTAIQHGDQAAKAALEPLISARYPTQLMQAGLDGLLAGVVVWIIAAKPRKPGVVGAWFLIVYAIGRVLMDFVRLPDAGISQLGGITRGQIYSAVMLIVGVTVLAIVRRSNADRITGGWLTRAKA